MQISQAEEVLEQDQHQEKRIAHSCLIKEKIRITIRIYQQMSKIADTRIGRQKHLDKGK